MNLSTFLQNDIISYLDVIFNSEKDAIEIIEKQEMRSYLSELKVALSLKDLTRAKQILTDAKIKYKNLDERDPQKEQLFKDIETIYSEIVSFMKQANEEKSEGIDQFDVSDIEEIEREKEEVKDELRKELLKREVLGSVNGNVPAGNNLSASALGGGFPKISSNTNTQNFQNTPNNFSNLSSMNVNAASQKMQPNQGTTIEITSPSIIENNVESKEKSISKAEQILVEGLKKDIVDYKTKLEKDSSYYNEDKLASINSSITFLSSTNSIPDYELKLLKDELINFHTKSKLQKTQNPKDISNMIDDKNSVQSQNDYLKDSKKIMVKKTKTNDDSINLIKDCVEKGFQALKDNNLDLSKKEFIKLKRTLITLNRVEQNNLESIVKPFHEDLKSAILESRKSKIKKQEQKVIIPNKDELMKLRSHKVDVKESDTSDKSEKKFFVVNKSPKDKKVVKVLKPEVKYGDTVLALKKDKKDNVVERVLKKPTEEQDVIKKIDFESDEKSNKDTSDKTDKRNFESFKSDLKNAYTLARNRNFKDSIEIIARLRTEIKHSSLTDDEKEQITNRSKLLVERISEIKHLKKHENIVHSVKKKNDSTVFKVSKHKPILQKQPSVNDSLELKEFDIDDDESDLDKEDPNFKKPKVEKIYRRKDSSIPVLKNDIPNKIKSSKLNDEAYHEREALNLKYLDAIRELKIGNKSVAISMFKELYKKQPNNIAVRTRLKEALS